MGYKVAVAVLALLVVAALAVLRLGVGTPGTESGDGRGASRPGRVPADAERAVVVDHVDGDTLRVRGTGGSDLLPATEDTTVRLLEIDTPESVAPGSPVECHAERSSAALARLLPLRSEVWVAPDRELLDQYGRMLLYVWDESGRFVNLELVASGHARAVLYEPNDRYIDQLRRAESRARSAAAGLWGRCEYFGEPVNG